MRADTLQAIKQHITHWDGNVGLLLAKELPKMLFDSDPLCKLYQVDRAGCVRTIAGSEEKCPVFEKSGERCCKGTPWVFIEEHLYFWKRALERRDALDVWDLKHYAELLKAMYDEIAYLKSLLPEGET